LPAAPDLGNEHRQPDPDFYADVAVLGFRSPAPEPNTTPVISLADGTALDASLLSYGRSATGVDVPRGTLEKPTVIGLTYDQPRTIRSASLFIPSAVSTYSPATIVPRLEASSDGRNWRKITDFQLSLVPTTTSFAPVTASHFRIVLNPAPEGAPSYDAGSAPGYAGFGAVSTGAGGMLAGNRGLRIQEMRLYPEARVNQFETKAGFSIARNYYELDADVGDDAKGIAPADVVDLTRRVRSDGTLDWTPPKGTWRVIRFGYSLVGATNHPAIAPATGLEVDKLDAAAVRDYLETYLQQFHDTVGSDLFGAHGLRTLVNDSTEVGAFNWTTRMLEQFKGLRGYDACPWLPALTGVIIGSRAASDKFLYDFRRTIADLLASEHYGTIARVAHEHGLTTYSESLEGWRATLGDDMEMRRYADAPMAALWMYPREVGPKPGYLGDLRGAASIAHLYSRNFVAAESMTTTRYPWAWAPSDLRRVIDLPIHFEEDRPVIEWRAEWSLDEYT